MYEIIDNFLPDDVFHEMQKFALSESIPWFLGQGVAFDDDGDIYFTHNLYRRNAPQSNDINVFAPLFDKLEFHSLVRAKLNLYVATDSVYEHGMHSDWRYHHKGCVFYFNTCDGYTKLADGTKVETIANRALLFDSSIPHCSTTCTNAPFRVTLNVNYFKGEFNPDSVDY